jgi:hypothetical protein
MTSERGGFQVSGPYPLKVALGGAYEVHMLVAMLHRLGVEYRKEFLNGAMRGSFVVTLRRGIVLRLRRHCYARIEGTREDLLWFSQLIASAQSHAPDGVLKGLGNIESKIGEVLYAEG